MAARLQIIIFFSFLKEQICDEGRTECEEHNVKRLMFFFFDQARVDSEALYFKAGSTLFQGQCYELNRSPLFTVKIFTLGAL